MSDKTTQPLASPFTVFYGWTISLSPDGLGLIVEAPAGKVIDFANSQFGFKLVGFKPDAKRLEVRAK